MFPATDCRGRGISQFPTEVFWVRRAGPLASDHGDFPGLYKVLRSAQLRTALFFWSSAPKTTNNQRPKRAV